MIPARRNTGANTYTALMCDALEEAGFSVEDLTVMPGREKTGTRLLRSVAPAWLKAVAACVSARYEIVHIHWPHAFAQDYSYPVAVLRSASLTGILVLHKLLGAHVVWTVHDVGPMVTQARRRLLTTVLIRATLAVADGLVFLSNSSMTTFQRRYPSASRKPTVLTRHAVYGDRIPRSDRSAARMTLGLPPECTVVGFIGDIKGYKGLDDLLEACLGLNVGGPVTLIAGAAEAPEAEAALGERVAFLQGRGLPITWIHRARLGDRDLSAVLAACDLVVLPYRVAWNSGMATLTLEHSRHLLCRDHPVFRELQQELGEQWVSVYIPPLVADTIVAAGSRARNLAESGSSIPQSFLDTRQWTNVIAGVIDFYDEL